MYYKNRQFWQNSFGLANTKKNLKLFNYGFPEKTHSLPVWTLLKSEIKYTRKLFSKSWQQKY